MKELFLTSIQKLNDLFDFILLLNARDKKSQDSQGVICASLRTVGKSATASRFYGGLFLLFSTALLLVLVGAVCIYGLLRSPFFSVIFYTGSFLMLFFVFIRMLLLPLLSVSDREKIALLIERKYPSLNNALISSIQLTSRKFRKEKVEYSGQLISLLVNHTAAQLRRLDLSRVISRKFLRLSGSILCLSAFVFGMVCVFHRPLLEKNLPLFFSYLIHEKGIDEKELPFYVGPVIGDITISYRYPLYAGLQPKTAYNTSGDIKALKGSEVQLSAISDRVLSSAAIIFNDSVRIPLLVENGKTMKGALSLLESGTYVFETTDAMNRIFKDVIPHKIQIEPDQYAAVSINVPAKDITVNEKDVVELKYTTNDDFGLSEISLVFEQEGERKTRTLTSFSKKQLQYSGAYSWSLSELNLKPDDKIPYHIEVKDSDTISGPKVSSSKTYYLEIYSSRKKHQELVQLQEVLLQELLHMLSDDLTKRVGDEKCASKDYLVMSQEGIQGRAEKIIHLFTDILDGMQEDTLANYSVYYSLGNLKNKFRAVTEKKRTAIRQSLDGAVEDTVPASVLNGLQKIQDEEVAEVEDIILFLNDLIQKQKLDEVADTGKNLIQSQNNIEKLLEKLQQGEDAKLSEQARTELTRIEETIRQMMEKLMKMAEGERMDEFLNADALKAIEQNDIMNEMDAMKNAFNKGDLNEALKAAQRLLSALQGMMDQMKSSSQKLADSSFSDMLNDANQLMDKISELENKQRELTENTDKLKQDITKRTSESTSETFKSFFEKQQKRLEAIKKDFSETKEALAKNKQLQEYLRVNRDLKRMAEERDTMAGKFSELFGGDEEVGEFQKESDNLIDLSRRNAELNREINKDPMQKDMLHMSRELPRTEETLSHLEEMLTGWDAKESLDLSKELAQNLHQWNSRMQNTLAQKRANKKEEAPEKGLEVAENIRDAENQGQQIMKDLESMMKFLGEQQIASLTQEDKDAMQEYSEKQKKLQEETGKLTERADELSEQNPFLDESADRQLDMASKSMGEAKQKLDKNDAQGAVIDERESLYRLAEAKKGMEMAKERIAKGMLGEGIPMPMQRPFNGRMAEGQFGASSEKVEIPSEEAYKVPREFREDILNALKEGLPEKYKDLNKDYYQRLVD